MDGAVLVQIVTAVCSSGAVYAGIRADIRAQKERIRRVELDVRDAHRRIDRQLEGRKHHVAPQAAHAGP
ncbi:hypothetical protein [Burkholderia vietnamiensis]|uniref:Uncharacterized protein n=1 Tax=Burkholderia vietnamiensis TaxID=60552 RepID=A0ABS1APH6_BURVI|nr:hypothetical protein [Burkholderia vietnamiensis]KVR79128.1 hypothetical protein WK26_18200 [Burkholderia vietnamiensis]KVS29257.1 hypothetical protein WK35_13465 [Burkholderia vietnamiensis]MBJ9686044.1 hypothetical protein [Burkholderia vietnamiensis]MBR8358328.1 hypothetical protein [Burkholderia vietnamiensis]UKV73158.1 hypothetical protein FOC29_04995 [Burkholderia vietnamiensis]